MLYFACILLALLLVWHVVNAARYYGSAYFKSTHTLYINVLRKAGTRGEYMLYRALKGFEKDGARFLFNSYIRKNDEEKT